MVAGLPQHVSHVGVPFPIHFGSQHAKIPSEGFFNPCCIFQDDGMLWNGLSRFWGRVIHSVGLR